MDDNLTKKDLTSIVAKEAELNLRQSRKFIDSLLRVIQTSLADNQPVKLRGFGTFSIELQKSRNGINPRTGERMTIPEEQKPKFKAGKEMTKEVNRFRPASEKRKLKRRNFIIDMLIIDRNDFREGADDMPEIGDLADITVEGIMLVSDKPIEEDKLYELKVILPEEVAEGRYIDFDARAIRCSETIHENIYMTGFAIVSLDDINKQKIRHLIERYAV